MDDKEMLERAAKAAGIKLESRHMGGGRYALAIVGSASWTEWNPYTDSGDALNLAVKLRIAMMPRDDGGWDCIHFDEDGRERVLASCENGGAWSLRDAIVRAAASMASSGTDGKGG